MKLLIVYASTEGQTRKIARHIADRTSDAGHTVELMPVPEADGVDPRRFDRVILAASVHSGKFQHDLTDFMAAASAALKDRPTLFLSVSLAAAGHDAEDWKNLDKITAEMVEATGCTPDRIEHVAGAYMPSRYDLVRRLIMRRIIAQKDPGTDTRADHEYTDWPALDATIDGWMAAAAP